MPRRPKTAKTEAVIQPTETAPAETVTQPAARAPTEPKKSKTAVIIAALQAHPDKMPKELAELLQAEGWNINAQRISTIKSKLKDQNKRKARRKPKTKAAPAEAPAAVAPAAKAEDGISFDSLKKAKQMAEQLGGIQQAKAAIAALAELMD
jgi:ribosomal protein L12E/L44/L45/RPP1/RPP2